MHAWARACRGTRSAAGIAFANMDRAAFRMAVDALTCLLVAAKATAAGASGIFRIVGLSVTVLVTVLHAGLVRWAWAVTEVLGAAEAAAVAASVAFRRPVKAGSCPTRCWSSSNRASRRKRSPGSPVHSV